MLRPWRKPPAPVILDLADKMGVMLIEAPPIECMNYWPQLVPETDGRIATEIREIVLRDRNHASVIYWELFNEIARDGLERLKHKMSLLARSLDPTRIVVDESGGWAEGAAAYLPYRWAPQPFNELHSYQRAPVDEAVYEFFLRIGADDYDPARFIGRSRMAAPGKLTFISELGYGGLPDLPDNVARYRREGNPLTPDYRYHHTLLAGVERGGTAIFLKPPLLRSRRAAGQLRRKFKVEAIAGEENRLLRDGVFPLKLETRTATGHWVPVNHGVKRYPIFDGLPSNGFMDQPYQNVCAAETITCLDVPPIVGSLSWDWGAGDVVRRSYLGPLDTWWGADLVIVPHGRGRLLLLTLIILEHLGKDPVADKLLFNMIRWAASRPATVSGR